MADGFEKWAGDEITRLRDEADHLDRTLARYLASHSVRPSADRTQTANSHPVRQRTSKNEPILQAIDRAGPMGLSSDEIIQIAKTAGLNTNRNAVRAFCWNEKQRGRLTQPAIGRFASALPVKDEAAGPNSLWIEPAASASAANQHREGDAGGGT